MVMKTEKETAIPLAISASEQEERYILNMAGWFFLLIIIGTVIAAIRVNFYL